MCNKNEEGFNSVDLQNSETCQINVLFVAKTFCHQFLILLIKLRSEIMTLTLSGSNVTTTAELVSTLNIEHPDKQEIIIYVHTIYY